jgi:nucleotide-binding universal stress UspA family protein
MLGVSVSRRIEVKNVLYLTDFSAQSDEALSFAKAFGRTYGSQIYAVHVLMPDLLTYMSLDSIAAAIELQKEFALGQMQRLEPQLRGLPHKVIVEQGREIWATLEPMLKERAIDLIVLGTHGRTGLQKLLLGSTAEKVFRRSQVPVMTIGPLADIGGHNDARFDGVVFATDFSAESLAAAPFAVSIAQENDAQLILLHVMEEPEQRKGSKRQTLSVAEAMHQLYELVPPEAELWCRPETAVHFGEPAERILDVAEQKGADLIVLGIRGTDQLVAATHLGTSTAHKVTAHAPCPVLTVRQNRNQGAQAN